jgi:hypothetical protein
MTYDASSKLAWSRHGLLLFLVLALGFGLITSHQPASAGFDLMLEAEGQSVLPVDARSRGAIVVAEREEREGKRGHGDRGNNDRNKNWGNKDRNKDWGNKDRNKDWSNDRKRDWSNNYRKRDWSNNKNWNARSNKNWSKNYNHRWGNGWSNYNNNWNKNWNKRSYVRDWGYRPYYGEFVGGVILGSLLAANGVGVVPYAPEPYLCWYWADPYMYRGYWDYCE